MQTASPPGGGSDRPRSDRSCSPSGSALRCVASRPRETCAPSATISSSATARRCAARSRCSLWIGSIFFLASQLIGLGWILNVVTGIPKPIGSRDRRRRHHGVLRGRRPADVGVGQRRAADRQARGLCDRACRWRSRASAAGAAWRRCAQPIRRTGRSGDSTRQGCCISSSLVRRSSSPRGFSRRSSARATIAPCESASA